MICSKSRGRIELYLNSDFQELLKLDGKFSDNPETQFIDWELKERFRLWSSKQVVLHH